MSFYRNQLLALMNPSDLALLKSFLEPLTLCVRDELEVPGGWVRYLYFPEDGIVSIVTGILTRDIEVGVIGRDGVVGASVLLDDELAVYRSFVQISGTANRIPVEALLEAVERSPTLRRHLSRYLRAFGLQVSSTALANGRFTIEARLARWLLMCLDRLDTTTIELTHEFLSLMLGVRRSGVTVALQTLEGERILRA